MIKERLYEIVESASYQEDTSSRVYDWIMYSAIILGLIPLMFRHTTKLLLWMDYVSCACFIVDYILRWYTNDIRRKKSGKNITGFYSYIVYPFTPMAIIDLLSILPTFTVISNSFKVARTLRLLKILRIIRATKMFMPLIILTNVLKRERGVLLTVLSMSVVYIFITALIMFNTEEGIDNEHKYETFYESVYWATCMLTTVGYGDIYPITTIGRLISMISSLVGVAVIALPSGVITAGYLDEIRERREKKNRKDKRTAKVAAEKQEIKKVENLLTEDSDVKA